MSRFAIAPEFEERVRRDEPMSRHTSWRVGGPADAWFTPRDVEDLSAFLRALPADVPVTWVGLGSNLLVRDGGIRGAVISVHGVLNALERVGTDSVRAEAGVPCARLGRQCAKWLIGPADFFAGIPGTIGGALAMNAGAWGGETWPCVVEAETIDRRGSRRRHAARRDDLRGHVHLRHVHAHEPELPRSRALLLRREALEIKPRSHRREAHLPARRLPERERLHRRRLARDRHRVVRAQRKIAAHDDRVVVAENAVAHRHLQVRRLRLDLHKFRRLLLHRLREPFAE